MSERNNMHNRLDVQEAEENILTFAPLTPLQSHPPHEDPEHPPCKKENVKFHTEPLGGSKHMQLALAPGDACEGQELWTESGVTQGWLALGQ